MDRTELQSKAAQTLFKTKRLVCQWATGTGKSRVALQFITEHPGMKTLILVPEQNNIENWKREFIKFTVPLDNVEIACYASFHKYKDLSFDFICFDEVPHIDTSKRRAICDTVKGEYILALGAVITDDELLALENVYGKFFISTINLDYAIKNNLLPIPVVYILHMELDNQSMKYWYNGERHTARGIYNCIVRKIQNAVDAYNHNASDRNKRKMLSYGNERKRFLGEMKQGAIAKICSELDKKNKRYICFCSSINQTIEVGGDERSFTSKSQRSMKHLERFNSGELNSLFVVGKCIEGENLKDVDCGVIGQIGGTKRITVQEIGRILRSDNPVIYVPVFDDTKDDGFLYTLTSSIPEKYIQHYKYNI